MCSIKFAVVGTIASKRDPSQKALGGVSKTFQKNRTELQLGEIMASWDFRIILGSLVDGRQGANKSKNENSLACIISSGDKLSGAPTLVEVQACAMLSRKRASRLQLRLQFGSSGYGTAACLAAKHCHNCMGGEQKAFELLVEDAIVVELFCC